MKVAVVGGGVMGAATAWRLTARGAEVVCFDRYSPPHTSGSSHGESRIIRTAYFEGAFYVPLLQEAFPLWRELESVSGARLLTMTGALYIGAADSKAVVGAQRSAVEHGLDIDVLTAPDLRKRYRGHVVHEGDVAVLDRQAGILNPEGAVTAMLQQVPDVRREHRVEAADSLLSDFDSVVVAAGPWTPELAPWIPLRVERQVHAWLSISRDADWFPPDRFPVFIRQTEQFGDVYGFPTLDSGSVKVGRHHDGDFTDPDHIRRQVGDGDLDPLRLMAATYLRGVSGHVRRTLTCMYTNTPDHDFVIDFAPGERRIVVISACSGHGFKFAPVIGDIAADLVCDGKTRRDISRFAAARFATPHIPDDHDHNDD
ncbi:MAG TPA: N-methyl-L-tryptophan oxidase [Candidatus Limnocylindrales bacterium]|nr:N-methyl-L-tryptophan oxidase [Candidatus Limnocylindrales bacterium]